MYTYVYIYIYDDVWYPIFLQGYVFVFDPTTKHVPFWAIGEVGHARFAYDLGPVLFKPAEARRKKTRAAIGDHVLIRGKQQ